MSKCGRCGRGPHSEAECPAFDAVCLNCHKRGHFRAYCRSRVVSAMTEQGLDKAFPGPVDQNPIDQRSSSWLVRVTVNNTPMVFKVATGAEVTTISQNSLSCLDVITLQNPLKAVYGPAGERLSVKGQFQATFCHEGHESLETVFVVNGQIPLAADSQSLTTFVTPFRRFCFNKLPFGISSAPEHFQREM